MGWLGHELRVGLRALRQRPGYTLLALVALAVGIGANTTIFSVVHAVLLRPLPWAEPERLVWIWESNPRENNLREPASVPNFDDWNRQNTVFESMAAFGRWRPVLTGAGDPIRLNGGWVTPNLFALLGADPVLGRGPTVEDGRSGGERVVVLADGLWRRRFGADPAVLGRQIELNGTAHTVVGVMPGDYRHLDLDGSAPAELWLPVAFDPAQAHRRSDFLNVVARMRDGVGLDQARADMTTIAARLEDQYPDTNRGWTVTVIPLAERFSGAVRTSLLVCLVAVAFLLLIACANVAALQLTRAAGRGRELAVRAALGAGRWVLVRQLLVESALLALVGGAVGALLATWGVEVLLALRPAELPTLNDVRVDGTVLAFTVGLSLITGLVFGAAPALAASRTDLSSAMREGGRGGGEGSGAGARRLRNTLVVAEIAVALLLLVGAGLAGRSLARLLDVNPGVDPRGVLTVQVSLPRASYAEPARIADFYERLLERVLALPGVESAAAGSDIPLRGANNYLTFAVLGRPVDPDAPTADAVFSDVTPDFFRALRIPLVAGRLFDARDRADVPAVAVINNAMARRYWPAGDAIGQRINTGDSAAIGWIEIVGVAGDVRESSLDAEAYPAVWLPHAQAPNAHMTLMIRAPAAAAGLAQAVRREVGMLDPALPVADVQTLDAVVADSTAQRRFSMILLGVFAAMALNLATVGIYGVVAHSVTQRTREIGVRMALGAARRDVLAMVLRHGLGLALAGVGLGLAAAFALTRLMAGLVYGISATDPPTFAAIALLLVATALAASWLPAHRATRIDPQTALRHD